MQVKDLIKDTLWLPAKNYQQHAPKISVLLPTYSRAKSGLFTKAVNAILNQSFCDFELIIVDDASIDGTLDLIKKYMLQDARVGCLIHQHNIGLPAISEYEAFMKARGEYIIFAFDDFIFETNAFAELYAAIDGTDYGFCHGIARIYYPLHTGYDYLLLGEEGSTSIFKQNTIANAAVIAKKEIFFQVGLYDPHIILTRICDWDLWIRISQHTPIKKINTLIGSEYGPTTKDSLGSNYFYNLEIAREYMLTNRNTALLPENYAEFAFTKLPAELNASAHFYIQELTHSYHNKAWFEILPKPKLTPKKIIFVSRNITNYALCFAAINTYAAYRVEFYSPLYTFKDLHCLNRADLIIFDSALENLVPLLEIIPALNIPYYYFTSDDRNSSFLNWDSLAYLKKVLTKFAGVLTGSESLKNYYLKNKLHTHVFCYSPSLDYSLLANVRHRNVTSPINIAIVEVDFRKNSIRDKVIPALNMIHRRTPIQLFIRNDITNFNFKPEFPCQFFDANENYYQFIQQLRQLKIDIIIHPGGKTENLKYKTNTILLTALYCNSNIIVTDEQAFLNTGIEEGIVKAENSIDGYLEAFDYVFANNNAALLKKRLHAYCTVRFNSENRIELLNNIMSNVKQRSHLHYERNALLLVEKMSAHILQLAHSDTKEHPQIAETFTSFLKKKMNLRLLRPIKYFAQQYYTNHDLSAYIQPQFNELMAYSIKNSFKKQQYLLRLSNPIYKNHPQYYFFSLNQASFSKIMIAMNQVENVSGFIGMQVILPDGKVAAQAKLDLNTINFNQPLIFSFPPVPLGANTHIRVKIFNEGGAQAFNIYEFRKKGLHSDKHKSLFCAIY